MISKPRPLLFAIVLLPVLVSLAEAAKCVEIARERLNVTKAPSRTSVSIGIANKGEPVVVEIPQPVEAKQVKVDPRSKATT